MEGAGSGPLLSLIGAATTNSTFNKTMTSDISALIDYYVREKELSPERVLHALQTSFLTAFRKMVPGAERIASVRADINPQKGTVRMRADMKIVPDGEVQDAYNEVPLSTARKLREDAQPGESITVNVTPKDFGRIAVQTARQTMQQSIRKAEQEMLADAFRDRVGEVVTGTVRRFDKGDVIVEVGKFEGVVPARQRIPGEDYAPNDKMRFYICEVRDGARGVELILSRSHPNLVRRLFESEVIEIADHTVEIRHIVREPGYRTKMVVSSDFPNVDPIGACVGMRGVRVKNIVNELNREKIDILEWTDDKASLVRQSLSPIEPRSVTVEEEKRIVRVVVDDDREAAKAKGRRGQNVRLTARLISSPDERWDVVVSAYNPKEEIGLQTGEGARQLSERLGIPLDMAEKLVSSGFTTLDVITNYAGADDLVVALGVSEEEAEAIIAKAKSLD